MIYFKLPISKSDRDRIRWNIEQLQIFERDRESEREKERERERCNIALLVHGLSYKNVHKYKILNYEIERDYNIM